MSEKEDSGEEKAQRMAREPLQSLVPEMLLPVRAHRTRCSWPVVVDGDRRQHVHERADDEADERAFVQPFDFVRGDVREQEKEGQLQNVNELVDDLYSTVLFAKGNVMPMKQSLQLQVGDEIARCAAQSETQPPDEPLRLETGDHGGDGREDVRYFAVGLRRLLHVLEDGEDEAEEKGEVRQEVGEAKESVHGDLNT